MAKFHLLIDTVQEKTYVFDCPACGCSHFVRARGKEPRWNVHGVEDDKPTVTPSIRVREGDNKICHSFITDGKIQYLGDCTHAHAGKTVDIPDYDV